MTTHSAIALTNSTYAMNDKSFTLHAHPTCGVGSTFTIMYAAKVDRSYDDDDYASERELPTGIGRDFHVLVSAAVSPSNKIRRTVRLSMWYAPTGEDLGNRTHVGMPIDIGNEAEVVMGMPTPFNFREFRAPPDADHPEGRSLMPGMTIFVEWSAMDTGLITLTPAIDMPVAYMQIVERFTKILCPPELVRLSQSEYKPEMAPIPPRPADREPTQSAPALTSPSPGAPPKRRRTSVSSAQ